MPVPYSEADTGSSGPCWGKKEQTVFKCFSLMIRTMVSHYSGTSAFIGNPISCAQADENGSMSSVLTG